MPIPAQLLGLLAQAAAGGDINPLAQILTQTGQSPPIGASQAAPFPAAPSPVQRTALPGATPSGLGGIKEALGVVKPQGAQAGVNPLEALQPPVQNPTQPAPAARTPGLGGQINPQIMQLILQALQGGQQPQAPAQSLGQILGQTR